MVDLLFVCSVFFRFGHTLILARAANMDVDHKHTSASTADNYASPATDVTDLQREKTQIELQMLRLKSNINAIEFQLNHNERVSIAFASLFFHLLIFHAPQLWLAGGSCWLSVTYNFYVWFVSVDHKKELANENRGNFSRHLTHVNCSNCFASAEAA